MFTARPDSFSRPVLVTGATGYIGGRLVSLLLAAGARVRLLVRNPQKLSGRAWFGHSRVEIVESDLSNRAQLTEALEGCGTAYYLIHSMIAAGSDYADRDRECARLFASSAERAGITRIVYLGGLGEMGEGLSDHLRSRREVESVLAGGSVPVTVLRAAMIIGAGSASFEVLRYLAERLPIMITPRWVETECQPIAVDNVLEYLLQCGVDPSVDGRVLDVGGADVMSYRQLLQEMARALGLRKRIILGVPVLTPRLSSLWIHIVTPIDASIARPLAEGLRNRVVCRDDEAARLVPQRLLGVREAIERALLQRDTGCMETTWTSAGLIPGDPAWAGRTTLTDRRVLEVNAPTDSTFSAVTRVGGENGWYAANWIWKLRGLVDRACGGPGLARGRRHPQEVECGEAIDFWRVCRVERPARLHLAAEMKLPGRARLEFEIEPGSDPGTSRLTQTACFQPSGLLGIFYWYSVLPVHGLVFGRMLQNIGRAAETALPPQDRRQAMTHAKLA